MREGLRRVLAARGRDAHTSTPWHRSRQPAKHVAVRPFLHIFLVAPGILLNQLHGDKEEALDACSRAVALNPTLAKAHAHRGIALGRTGADARAVLESYARAVALDPKEATVFTNKGVVLDQLGSERWAEALAAHERAIGGDLQALPVLVGAGRQMDAYVPACVSMCE